MHFLAHTSMSAPSRIAVATALISAGSFAQQGPASSLASGLSFADPMGPSTVDDNYLNPPLSSTPIQPIQTLQIGQPDYSLDTLFPDHYSVIEIDAHDTGNATIPGRMGSSEHPDLQGESWMEVVISYVDNPISPSPLIAGSSNKGSELLGYFLSNSGGIATEFIGQTYREQTAVSMGLTNSENIDALDYAIGVQSFASTGSIAALFSRTGEYYFSISSNCASAVNSASSLLGTTFAQNGVTANGSSIYMMEWIWNGTSGRWSQPEEVLTPGDLGLDEALARDDVDALAFDSVSGNAIFSTSGFTAGRSQLMYYTADPTTPNVTALGNGTTGRVTTEYPNNDETTDVDAVCIIDPEMGAIASHFGTPIESPKLAGIRPASLGLSMTREDFADNGGYFPVVQCEFTGMEIGNDDLGFVIVGYQIDYTGGPFDLSSWTSAGAILFDGTTESVSLPLALSGPGANANLALFGLYMNQAGVFTQISAIEELSL